MDWKNQYYQNDYTTQGKLQVQRILCQITNGNFSLTRTTMQKAMAPHSSTLAWKIPWMEESGRLQSMWSLRVGHDWATSLSLFTFMHWRRKWQPSPVFLPGESQGQGSLVGCCPWGCTESDTTKATYLPEQQQQQQKSQNFMETQKTLKSQRNLEKEKWSWRNQAPWLQTILQSYSHQNSMVLAQN